MAEPGRKATNNPSQNIHVDMEKLLETLPKGGDLSHSYSALKTSFKQNDAKGKTMAATAYYRNTVDSKGVTALKDSQLQMLRPFLDSEVLKELLKKGKKFPPFQESTSSTAIDDGSSAQATLTPTRSSVSPKPGSAKRDGNKGSEEDQLPSHELKRKLDQRTAELNEKEKELTHLQEIIDNKESKFKDETAAKRKLHQDEMLQLQKDKSVIIMKLEKQVNANFDEKLSLETELKHLKAEKENKKAQAEHQLRHMEANWKLSLEKTNEDHKRKVYDLKDKYESELRAKDNTIKELIKARDDLRDRFSKVAGDKLMDKNADIADLSDPNRAMKLSERFGQLYDDEWTNAFEALTDKKIPVKDTIQFLLRVLQDCLSFCNNMIQTQMDSIKNVFLHPSQDVTKFVTDPRKNVGGLKDRPRIETKDEKALCAVRRQIGVNPNIIEEVKKVFYLDTKSWDKKGYDKKLLDLCTPYLQKCAEICWLMVLHDPPLSMKLEVKPGEKLDPNFYTVYSTSGDKIDYLVWPPLYNGKDGGLLSKGVAEPLRLVKKK